jgi:hypothetical protein
MFLGKATATGIKTDIPVIIKILADTSLLSFEITSDLFASSLNENIFSDVVQTYSFNWWANNSVRITSYLA